MVELSILIPARNEMFLKDTVEDILKNSEASTEIIVVLDGQWAEPSIAQHPKVKVIYLPKSIGQRAATNLACSLSKAKYVMKVDAHCAFDKGFDRILLEDMNDNWTVVPLMRNLHVFDWVCECGFRKYQGPTIKCEKCGKEMKKEMIWHGKESPASTSYRFNRELEFKYWGAYKKKQIGDIVDTMSLQGSCFMMTREKYWELNICDETWGSWGGQGAEVSLKTILSGGEVKVNKKTWYAHLFRTQGGDFGFPYPNPGNEQRKAKNTLRDTFLNNKWENQIYPLSYIIEKFNPPEWEEKIIELKESETKLKRSGIYSIKSKNNNKVYIGSTVEFSSRFNDHRKTLKNKTHVNKHLQNHYNKYGQGDLEFNILLFCDKEMLIDNEQIFIDEYKELFGWNNLFNICPVAQSSLGRECSEETKKKISESQSGKEAWNKGLTKETDERLKELSGKMKGNPIYNGEHPKGMLGKKHNEEIKEQISESMRKIAKDRLRDKKGHFIKNLEKGIIFYTDNQLNLKIAHRVQKQLKKSGLPIVSSSLKPMAFGANAVIKEKRGQVAYFKQILSALERSDVEIVYFCEHDVLYHPSHFDFTPTEDKFYFNTNVYKWKYPERHFLKVDDCKQISGMVCFRNKALEFYREKVRQMEAGEWNKHYEPQLGRGSFQSEFPNIDIRHDSNLTKNRWSKKDFRNQKNTEGWIEVKEINGWEGLNEN